MYVCEYKDKIDALANHFSGMRNIKIRSRLHEQLSVAELFEVATGKVVIRIEMQGEVFHVYRTILTYLWSYQNVFAFDAMKFPGLEEVGVDSF